MKLYEIQRDYFEIINRMASDELTEEERRMAQVAIDGLGLAKDQKLANICGLIKNLKGDLEAFEAEEKRLKERRQSKEREIVRLKEYVGYCCPNEKWRDGVHALSWITSPAMEIDESNIRCEIPEQYQRIKTIVEPDKKLMLEVSKQAEAEGKPCVIPGWHMVKRKSLVVK
jgi:hypothetical protein